jgi:hypothetical protein
MRKNGLEAHVGGVIVTLEAAAFRLKLHKINNLASWLHGGVCLRYVAFEGELTMHELQTFFSGYDAFEGRGRSNRPLERSAPAAWRFGWELARARSEIEARRRVAAKDQVQCV